LIGNRTSIHKALITCEGISAISLEKALNSSNIAVFRTSIGADNPWSTSNLFYTVTIVLRYNAGVIVSDTGFKPQNMATVNRDFSVFFLTDEGLNVFHDSKIKNDKIST